MTQRKKLVLHIGTHKTGTTYLQNTLARNADRFLENGVLYPKSGQIHNAHFKLCWQLQTPDLKGAALTDIPEWKGLIDEFRTSPAHTAIVSSEEFAFSIAPHRLAELKTHFDVQVICFIRSPDGFMQSFYNQFVKDFVTREARTLTRYLAEDIPFFLDNRPMLEGWVSTFGKAVTVCNFETRVEGETLLDKFFGALGLSPPTDLQGPSTDIIQKVSLPPDALEYLRLSNPYLKDAKRHHAFVVELVQATKAEEDMFHTTRSGLLSLPSRQMLRTRFAAQNVWMSKTFWGIDKNPFPVDEAPPPPEDFESRPEEADVHTISRVAAKIRETLLHL